LKSPNDKADPVVCDANFANLSVHLANMNGFATLRTLNQIVQTVSVAMVGELRARTFALLIHDEIVRVRLLFVYNGNQGM
jgi:hypothetical protein